MTDAAASRNYTTTRAALHAQQQRVRFGAYFELIMAVVPSFDSCFSSQVYFSSIFIYFGRALPIESCIPEVYGSSDRSEKQTKRERTNHRSFHYPISTAEIYTKSEGSNSEIYGSSDGGLTEFRARPWGISARGSRTSIPATESHKHSVRIGLPCSLYMNHWAQRLADCLI